MSPCEVEVKENFQQTEISVVKSKGGNGRWSHIESKQYGYDEANGEIIDHFNIFTLFTMGGGDGGNVPLDRVAKR